jgi:hypothetical protein
MGKNLQREEIQRVPHSYEYLPAQQVFKTMIQSRMTTLNWTPPSMSLELVEKIYKNK